MAASSPAQYARTSTGMRRFRGTNGADVRRSSGATLGDHADRAGAEQQRIGKKPQKRVRRERGTRPARGDPMAQITALAVLEVGPDGVDLEAGVLEQFDERGSRVED